MSQAGSKICKKSCLSVFILPAELNSSALQPWRNLRGGTTGRTHPMLVWLWDTCRVSSWRGRAPSVTAPAGRDPGRTRPVKRIVSHGTITYNLCDPISWGHPVHLLFFLILTGGHFCIYLQIERGEGERNIDVRGTHRVAATHMSPTGAGDELQPRYLPLVGTEPGTLRSTGWRSNCRANPARAQSIYF
uniref:Uncharacterized protein n=1 Tax=Molossus molossus TaxID=27622 RepID=A0A7J8DTH7_MOLMO|nr:hypothetical protein HJG59_009098 [Molossus molossus]